MGKTVGIDLGTTNTLVALMERGELQIIPNAEGSPLTPSVVGFAKNGERLVGELAKRQAISNPERTVVSIKRQMGSAFKAKIDDREYSPPEIASMILQKIKADAEAYLNEPISKAVITVPAYFSDSERQATKDAGTIAGLDVIRIVNEPTAAAMAYGLDKMGGTQTVLVFDLGGGTFDVSILTIDNGVFEVIATSGDMKLGGDDWDRRIMDYLIDEFKKSNGIDLRSDRIAMQRLKEAAEAGKWELSEKESTKFNLPFIAAAAAGPKHLEIELTRAKFEELTHDLAERLSIPAKRALDDSKIPMGQIEKVILVGGATRMPMVRQLAAKIFKKEPSTEVDAEKVVAFGAAIQAAILAGEVKDLVLLDVNSLSLGIETTGGVFTPIIERNNQIPCQKKKIFSTVADGQTAVEVRIFQGERELTQNNKFLGSFELGNIPPAPRGVPQIEVTFDIDANGIVHASAKDLATGNRQKITIQSPTNLAQDEINRMLAEAATHYNEDSKLRNDRQVRNKAAVEIEVAEKTIRDYPDLLPKESKDEIQSIIADLKGSLEKDDLAAAESSCTQLRGTVFNATSLIWDKPAEKKTA